MNRKTLQHFPLHIFNLFDKYAVTVEYLSKRYGYQIVDSDYLVNPNLYKPFPFNVTKNDIKRAFELAEYDRIQSPCCSDPNNPGECISHTALDCEMECINCECDCTPSQLDHDEPDYM